MKSDVKIRMDIGLWTYQDFNEFLKAYQAGNQDVLYKKAQEIIVSWDYQVPLSHPEALMELGVSESTAVVRTVWETINTFAEGIDESAVKIDFSPWNSRKFFTFDLARRQEPKKAEKMLHEIAQLEGVSPDAPLPFEAGAMMYKAVTEAYKRLVSGKF